jgi:hypothetical protein
MPRDTESIAHADVDPTLERQLARAADNDLVEAVLLLRGDDEQRAANPDALLARVCRAEPAGAVERNYLPRLGALIVRARACIIRRLIAQPEVELACANRV